MPYVQDVCPAKLQQPHRLAVGQPVPTVPPLLVHWLEALPTVDEGSSVSPHEAVMPFAELAEGV